MEDLHRLETGILKDLKLNFKKLLKDQQIKTREI